MPRVPFLEAGASLPCFETRARPSFVSLAPRRGSSRVTQLISAPSLFDDSLLGALSPCLHCLERSPCRATCPRVRLSSSTAMLSSCVPLSHPLSRTAGRAADVSTLQPDRSNLLRGAQGGGLASYALHENLRRAVSQHCGRECHGTVMLFACVSLSLHCTSQD